MSNFDKAAKSASEAPRFVSAKLAFQRAVFEDPRLSHRDMVVANYLIEKYIHKRDGVAWPKKKTLADCLNMKERPVGDALKKLVHCGILIQGHSGGGSGKPNEYAVDWSKYEGPNVNNHKKRVLNSAPFSGDRPETVQKTTINHANNRKKRVLNSAPPKNKGKGKRKGTRDAAPDLAMGPSGTASGKNGAQQGRGAGPNTPFKTAAQVIADKLTADYQMGPIEARRLLRGSEATTLGNIASRLDSLSRAELIGKLRVAAT